MVFQQDPWMTVCPLVAASSWFSALHSCARSPLVGFWSFFPHLPSLEHTVFTHHDSSSLGHTEAASSPLSITQNLSRVASWDGDYFWCRGYEHYWNHNEEFRILYKLRWQSKLRWQGKVLRATEKEFMKRWVNYGTNTVVDGVAVHAGACVCSVLICSASTLCMPGKHSTIQLLHYLTLRSFGTVRWLSG